MNIAIATSLDAPLDGVFWQAYMNAGGCPPTAVFFLGTGKSLNHSLWQRLVEPLILFRLGGTMRLLSSVYVKLPLTVRDRKLGVKMVGSDILKSSASHCYYCESLEQEAAFRTMQPDLLVSVGSSKIFKRSTLELPRIGTINIHNAQIPKYRGHFGTFWEAYHRENWGYICIHEVVQKVDAGRIIALDRVKISDFSSFLDLLIEKKRRGGILLAQTIREIQDQGSLLEAEVTPDDTEVAEGYYGWPSFSDLLKFRESSPNE